MKISNTTWNSVARLIAAIVVVSMVFVVSGGPQSVQAQENSAVILLGDPETQGPHKIQLDPTSGQRLAKLSSGVSALASIKQASFQQSVSQDLQPTISDASAFDQTRLDSIQKQISLIRELVQKEKAKDASKLPVKEVPANQPEISTAVAADKLQPPVPIESETSIEPMPDPLTDPALPESGTELVPTQPMASGTPVVAQPINPFKLASSLFLTGNIEASRKSYEAGLKDASPDEMIWLKCFIGCCYRLEGDFANAESVFREVTQHRAATFPVDYAKWCLKYLEQRRNALEQFGQIEAEIESIMKELETNDGT